MSARGAPGTTTLALATAVELSERGSDVLLVEADPVGGVLTADLGLPVTPGIIEFSADANLRSCEGFRAGGVHHLSDRLALLTAPSSARQAAAAWASGAASFVDLVRALDEDVVLDLGRGILGGGAPALDLVADRTVHVVRPVVCELAALIASLREHDSDASMRVLMVVDPPSHSAQTSVHPREVEEVLNPYGIVLAVPWDPSSAAQIRTAPMRRKWARARVGVAVGELVDTLISSDASPLRTQPAGIDLRSAPVMS